MSRARLAALALLFWACATAAVAQVREISQGVEIPATSFALLDDATAISANPAGLGYVRGLGFDYVHERTFRDVQHADALFLAAGAGPIAVGSSLEWVHTGSECVAATPCFRRFTIGGALRFGRLSLGVARHGFSSDESSAYASLGSWDFGVLLRPARWLSLGYTVLDTNEPAFASQVISAIPATSGHLPRRHVAAIGLRPFGERVTFGIDARFRACDESGQACGIDSPDGALTVEARVLRGLTLLGQAGFDQRRAGIGAATDTTFRFQIGAQIDFAHLGLRSAPRFRGGDPGTLSTEIRLTTQPWEGVSFAPATAADVDLDKALRRPGFDIKDLVFGSEHRDPLERTLEMFSRLSRDGSVKAVVLRTRGMPLGAGRSEELREGIEGLRRAGKKVLFYLESGGDLDYAVASVADRIVVAPQAILAVNGFSATALFAGAGLEKLGVKAEFVRVGAYKNAPDVFTRSDMSQEQREVTNALLDDVFGRYVSEVSRKRHLDEGKFRRLLDRGLLTPQEALREGLVDGLAYPDQLEEEVRKVLGGSSAFLRKTSLEQPSVRDDRWAPRPRIGIVRVEGDIARGSGGSSPFGGVEIAGSDSIARRIHALADDPAVRAIVVRIDSPGGDGTASDLIWRELVRAREEKHKPVVASMGDVAASGGYYVAVAADRIYAEPSTITGSIGVFIGKFDLHSLYGGLGLTLVTNKRGESADLFTTARPLTDAERQMMQGWVDAFYAEFVDRVASGRKMSSSQVDALGRGRVWSGAQALQRGLVDRMGGLRDALVDAKQRAGFDPGDEVAIDDPGRSESRLGPDVSVLPEQLRGLGEGAARLLALLGEPGTLRAALPFDLEVH
ncbi:MAG: signal peptide peptidase SppA [Deltaproteobacteria bacterium]|nr:MAG: signal peptide peptidase SppA [Deltaproteobacteria bacterium]